MNAKNKHANDPSRLRDQKGIKVKGRHAGQDAVEQAVAMFASYFGGRKGSDKNPNAPSAANTCSTMKRLISSALVRCTSCSE